MLHTPGSGRIRLLGVGRRLVWVVVSMLLAILAGTFLIYSRFETDLLAAVQDQTEALSKALEISLQHLTTKDAADAAVLDEYVQRLDDSGVTGIAILGSDGRLLASAGQATQGHAGEGSGTRPGDGLVVSGVLAEPTAHPNDPLVDYTLDIPIVVNDVRRGHVLLHLLLEDLRSLIHEERTKRTLFTIAVFGVGIAIVVPATIWMTRGLRELGTAAGRVASGDLTVRIQTERHDEIGDVIRTFNQMVERLRAQMVLERRLHDAEREAAAGTFAAAVAHEIGNPLNMISLSVDHLSTIVAAGSYAGQAEVGRIVDAIREEIGRLDRLLGEFRRHGRSLQLTLAACSVDELLDGILVVAAAQARAQGVEIARAIEPGLPAVVGDAEALRAVFLNLATNAMQAMPQGGRLTVTASSRPHPTMGEAVAVTFRDDGPGIAPENLERVFEPYFSSREAGLGLGLAITRRIVEECGGTIRALPSAEPGATFEVELPSWRFADAAWLDGGRTVEVAAS